LRGRIDHMAIDVKRQRLFVAELGNDSVGVVNLKEGKTVDTIRGLAEPQGVSYAPPSDTLYVANARDGSVRLFQGVDDTPAGRIDLGDDADNGCRGRSYLGELRQECNRHHRCGPTEKDWRCCVAGPSRELSDCLRDQ
jgi:hypothetical protein